MQDEVYSTKNAAHLGGFGTNFPTLSKMALSLNFLTVNTVYVKENFCNSVHDCLSKKKKKRELHSSKANFIAKASFKAKRAIFTTAHDSVIDWSLCMYPQPT